MSCKRRLDRLAERAVDAVGEQGVETGAFVDLVEVDDRLALADRPSVDGFDRRAVVVVEHALGEVGGGHQVLQALLVLDADHVAAESLRDAGGGDVHAALVEDLIEGEIGLRVVAEMEGHALLDQPVVDRARLGVGNLARGGVERGLRQALLEHAEREQKLVGDDGVVHPHAAFVEDAHDRTGVAKVWATSLRDRAGLVRRRGRNEGVDVRQVVGDVPDLQPLVQLLLEEIVGEGFAPQRASRGRRPWSASR